MSLLPYFYDIDGPLRMMEREFFRPDFFRSPVNWRPRDFFAPSFFKSWDSSIPWDIMRPMEQLSKQMSQLAVKDVGIAEDDEKFQVSVDVQHFSPEEISVKVLDGHVVVEGNHEEKLDEHGYVKRQFVRRYALPEGCLPDTVESSLSLDGVLTVTAPRVLPLPAPGERIVPITKIGPVQKQLSSPVPETDKMEESATEKSN